MFFLYTLAVISHHAPLTLFTFPPPHIPPPPPPPLSVVPGQRLHPVHESADELPRSDGGAGDCAAGAAHEVPGEC